MTITRRTTVMATALVGGWLALGQTAIAQTRWDMPTPYPEGNFHTRNIKTFAEDVARATGNKLVITVHSGASLLKLPEIKRAVQTGQVQIGETLISTLGNEDAMFAFDAVPGLATSYETARKLYNTARPFLDRRFGAQGLKMLYSVAWPPQGIYARKELSALTDLKGAKFRAYNPATARFAELIGASPVTVQAAEIAQAFRTGVAEAMISSGATGVDSQAWDFLSHYYDLSAFLPQNVVLVNKAAFDALPADARAAIETAARAAEDRGWKLSAELNEGYKKTMAERGIKVLAPPPAMAAEARKIGDTMAAEWAKRAGADGVAVLDTFRK